MLSNKPYLIRAFYDWITDSGCTPYLVINATFRQCNVPQEFVENGEITLNISKEAIRDLVVTNEHVKFRASFSGVVHIIFAPIKAVLAIYAQENQQGMFFDYEEDEGDSSSVLTTTSTSTSSDIKKKPSHLKLVE